MLSASANKLSRLKEQAEEYAALIMEELDPERFGYIEVGFLKDLALTMKFICQIRIRENYRPKQVKNSILFVLFVA